MQVPLNLFWFVFQMKSNRTENVENLKRKKDYRLNPNFKYEEGGSLPKAHWPTCLAVCLPMNFWNFSSTDTTGKLNLAFMFNRKQLGMLLWFSFDEIWQLSFSPYKSTISWCLYSLWFHRVLHFQNKLTCSTILCILHCVFDILGGTSAIWTLQLMMAV